MPNTHFLFAVSNKHVVADFGASVIRLNRINGGVDIIEMEPHDWHFTNQQDLAIRIKPIEETYVAHTLGFLFQAIRAIAGGEAQGSTVAAMALAFRPPKTEQPE